MANLQEDLKKNKNRTELLKRAVEEKKKGSAAQAAKDIKTATENEKKTKLPTKKTGTSSIKKPPTVVKNGVTGLSYDTNPYSKEKVAAFWENLATGDDKFGKRYAGFGQGIVDATAAIPNLIGSIATGKNVNLQERTGLNVPSEALRATPEFKQGQFAGELTGYATQNIAAAPAINKILAGTKLANGGFKSAMARNAVEAGTVGLAQNVGIAHQQGLTGMDMAKDVAINTAVDLGLGGVAESLPFALDAVKTRRAANETKKALRTSYIEADKVPRSHKKVYKEYVDSVDTNMVNYVRAVNAGANMEKEFNLNVQKNDVAKIKALTGVDTTGYETVLDLGHLDHINKRHGKNGVHNHSMANPEDFGRARWVIENYDKITLGDKVSGNVRNGDNSRAKQVVYTKRVDGHVYVVEAVPDNKAKKMYITSMYIEKADELSNKRARAEYGKSPQQTSETSLPKKRVSQDSPEVKAAKEKLNQLRREAKMDSFDNETLNLLRKGLATTDEVRQKSNLSNRENIIKVYEAELELNKLKAAQNSKRPLKPGGADVAKATDSIEEIRKKYGTFEGSDVPKRTAMGDVQQGARTIRNSDILDDEAVAALEEGIRQGDYWKTTITNKSAVKEAKEAVEADLQQATASFQSVLTDGRQATSKDIAKGYELAQKYIELKDYDMVESILADVSAMESEAGRTLQAMRIFSNLSPAGRVKSALRGIDKLSTERGVNVKVNQKLLDDIYNATTDAEIAAANKAFAVDVWNQIPATFNEKMNAWRYLAMLGNPKTHIRNVLGNVIYQPARMLSDSIAMVTEKAMKGRIQRLSDGEISGSKAFVGFTGKDAEYRKAARQAYKDNKASIEAVTSKFNEQHRPSEARVYKFKPLEAARRGNSRALEAEDNAFKQLTFQSAYAQYCKANKLDVATMSDEVKEQAVNYAYAQALKATYQDPNMLADAISKFKRKFETKPSDSRLMKAGKIVGHQVVESTLPFVKTPTNILKRGIEYSPAGVIGGVVKIASAKNADDLLKGIEYFSQGLTGSGLIALGYYMANKGWINGSMGEYDKKYAYDQMLGEQSYSVNTENGTYTVDWLAPLSMPFFVGVETANLLGSDNDADMWKVIESFSSLTEPVFEMSMLSGLENTFDVTFSSDSKVKAILENSLEGYLSQFIPTISGQLARTLTPERKMNLSTAETKTQRTVDKYLDKLQNRIPGITEWNEPYVDQWGRTDAKRTTADYWLSAAENFLSPGYYSERNITPVDKELAKLYEALGETEGKEVIPALSGSSYKQKFDGTEYYMTEKEFTQYKKTVGQASYSGLKNLFASEEYKKATTDDKRKMVKKVYDAAKEKGKEQFIVGSKIATKEEYAYSTLTDSQKAKVDESGVTAVNMRKAINTLQEAGVSQGKSVGKAYALIGNVPEEVMTAYGLSDKAISGAKQLRQSGLEYSTFEAAAEKIDKNDNDSYSVEEIRAYLDGNSNYTRLQKRAIFGALSSAKYNPY